MRYGGFMAKQSINVFVLHTTWYTKVVRNLENEDLFFDSLKFQNYIMVDAECLGRALSVDN